MFEACALPPALSEDCDQLASLSLAVRSPAVMSRYAHMSLSSAFCGSSDGEVTVDSVAE